jgi:tRNA U34 5-carboxymethylaminomethyl modifying GTPase MnmE/TrmE
MDLGGVSCLISDTAGLRYDSNDPIELEGISRAREAFNGAQIKVFVSDANDQESLQVLYNLLFYYLFLLLIYIYLIIIRRLVQC